jgi:hypothetical protein
MGAAANENAASNLANAGPILETQDTRQRMHLGGSMSGVGCLSANDVVNGMEANRVTPFASGTHPSTLTVLSSKDSKDSNSTISQRRIQYRPMATSTPAPATQLKSHHLYQTSTPSESLSK